MSRIHWLNSASNGPMLFAMAEREEREPLGMTTEERSAWLNEHPLPTLLVMVIGNTDGFSAIAFESENGWWNALTKGERKELTPRETEGARNMLRLSETIAIAEAYAREWTRANDTEPERCGERTWRNGPNTVVRCTLPYAHEEAVHLASDGHTWRSAKP